MNLTQIVFVGHHQKKLYDSIREYPPHKIILVVGAQESSGEIKAREIANIMAEDLQKFWVVEEKELDKVNIMKATLQIMEWIKTEKIGGNEIILNVSSSLRTFTIAAYIAACLMKVRIITSIPEYDEAFEEVGAGMIVELPTLPINSPGIEQLEIMSVIESGIDSLDDVIIKLHPTLQKGSNEFRNQRSRVSHHLKNLETLGYIIKEREGRNIRIHLNNLGQIFIGTASNG